MEVGKYPGISIIIPAYNEEKALERTLLHFLPFKEKYNLEIIVADDASTDRTVEIAERFADKVVLNRTGRRARSGSWTCQCCFLPPELSSLRGRGTHHPRSGNYE